MPRSKQPNQPGLLSSTSRTAVGRQLPVIIILNGREIVEPVRFPEVYFDEMPPGLKRKYVKYQRDAQLINSAIVADTEETWCRFSRYARMGRDTRQVVERNGFQYVVLDIDLPIDEEVLLAVRIWILFWQPLAFDQPIPHFEPDWNPGWINIPLLTFIAKVYRAGDLLQLAGHGREGSSLREELQTPLQFSRDRRATDEMEEFEVSDWIEVWIELHKGKNMAKVDQGLINEVEAFLDDFPEQFEEVRESLDG